MSIRPGYTLIEALIALFVASFAVIIGYSAFAMALDARVHVSARAQATVRAVALRTQLAGWIASAHTPTDTTDYRFLLRDTNGDGYGDELSFVTRRLRPYHDQTREVVLRWLVEDNAQSLIARTRVIGTDEFDPPITVSRWIREFTVRVLPADGDAWLGHWTSAVALPIAVELHITSANADSLSTTVETPLVVRLYATQ